MTRGLAVGIRFLRQVLLVAVLGALFLPFGIAVAQDGTPQASPEATPAAVDPAEARLARLGGQLADVIETYGQPDWVDAGLAGYNNINLAGVDTITMVYYDDQERVRSYLLVYLEQPDDLDSDDSIAEVVAEVAPRDGECDQDRFETDLGGEVFGCESVALKGLLSPAEMLAFDVIGADGAYSYAINPTDDDFYEIAVRIGTDRPRDPQDPEPTIVPTPKPPLEERYPPLERIDDLTDGAIRHGDAVTVSGTIIEIAKTEAGVKMLVELVAEDSATGNVEIVVLGDIAGYGPGSAITVYGMYSGAGCEVGGSCMATIYVIEPLN